MTMPAGGSTADFDHPSGHSVDNTSTNGMTSTSTSSALTLIIVSQAWDNLKLTLPAPVTQIQDEKTVDDKYMC